MARFYGLRFFQLTVTLFTIISTVHSQSDSDRLCEITAQTSCTTQNYDLVVAATSNDANEICLSYHRYRDCLYQNSNDCDQDFIGALLDRSCDNKCGKCGGAGSISGSLSTVIIVGTLVCAYLSRVF